jgi:DNA polymerase III epsilon subunit-like protein
LITFGYDIETTGPNPFENKLVTIQYRRNDQNYIFKIWDYGSSERDLIIHFLSEWNKISYRLSSGGDYFVTYNLRLDAPFLLTRCLLNDIATNIESRKHLWNILIHGPVFLDLYQLLGDELARFDSWISRFGLTPGRFRNSDIPHMYNSAKYSEIEEYVNDELLGLEKMYLAVVREPFFQELQRLRRKVDLRILS